MEEEKTRADGGDAHGELRSVIRSVIDEFMRAEQVKTEPAYQAELIEERRRREQLEQKVNELATENKRNKQIAEEAEKQASVRAELQRLGVAKVDLAFRVVRDDIRRGMEAAQRAVPDERGVDLSKIRPGMDPEELNRIRKEVSRIAAQSLRGQ